MPLTYLLFLARPLGLYSSHASKLGSQQRGWENTLNYSLYYAPKMSTTPVSLVLPFLQFFGCFLQGAVILGPRQYKTALVFELSEKELLRLKAAVENTPAQGRTGWNEERKWLFNWFNYCNHRHCTAFYCCRNIKKVIYITRSPTLQPEIQLYQHFSYWNNPILFASKKSRNLVFLKIKTQIRVGI